jgi:hypothetical protein
METASLIMDSEETNLKLANVKVRFNMNPETAKASKTKATEDQHRRALKQHQSST